MPPLTLTFHTPSFATPRACPLLAFRVAAGFPSPADDHLEGRMGRDTVFYAGSGIRRDWKAFANMKTQRFTTDWRQLLRVSV